MEVARGGGGGKLNPWAAPFVPAGWSYYRCGGAGVVEAAEAEVEDFSPEWWRLVGSSPAFRDRWLRDYSALGLLDGGAAADDEEEEEEEGFLPDDIFSSCPDLMGEEEEKESKGGAGFGGGKKVKGGAEVVAWGIDKWWRAHSSPPEVPSCCPAIFAIGIQFPFLLFEL
ncbi:hypothetical protein E2562_002892 [Oryza meyeriana var. granulata]|uniref:Ataxin-2 C-terminal domain-containing protein n=1 Tax=Oryza meyeriana var. granulata TaxID=110450 RepID=A0A6G1DD57_9ORYZ|nr:hypothetical protein E2562_002892 [Oryza meyeriana var. granulata]